MSRVRTVVALAALAVALALPAAAQAVVGGTPPSRDYGFMAAMLWDGSQYCGASLVAPQQVLTAAHCWDDEDPDTDDPKPSEVEFAIGVDNLTLDDWDPIAASSVEIHPGWDPDSLSYDVALVRLSEPSTATPIPLADPATEKHLWVAEPGPTAERKPARVIGYGLPSFDPPGQLFETDVPMVADEDCARNYDLTGGGFDATTMVCAGEAFGVKDSCFGDSGGPLMVARDGNLSSGPLVQVGVVSWGFLCGVPQQPGVYSRVGDDPLYSWIQQRIGSTSTRAAKSGRGKGKGKGKSKSGRDRGKRKDRR
jgi:trypsin